MNNHMLLVTLNDTLGKENLYMTVELSQVELNKMEEIYKRNPRRWGNQRSWKLFQEALKELEVY